MSIITKKVISKKITFKEKDLGEKIAQVDVFIGGGKKINLILNNEIVLRFDIKKEKKDILLEKLKSDSLKKFKLLNRKNNSILKDILISEVEIRTNINKDKNGTIDRDKSKEKDFINGIEIRCKEIVKLGKKLGFNLSGVHKEFYCRKCGAFRTGPGIKYNKKKKEEKINCLKCRNILISRKFIHLTDNVYTYLNGQWLQDYIAHILNSLGWIAWSSSNLFVYGVSGYPHQIDVLAIKNGVILIVECKTGEFNQKDVKDMLAKYYDIRCHYALAVSLPRMHPEAKKIIEKNPAIRYCDDIKNIGQIKKIISKL